MRTALPLASLAVALSLAALPIAAQTPAPPAKPHAPAPAAHAASGAHACAKLPDLSPKIPALPAGLPCARSLYTISTVPPVKLENVSPLEGPGLRETLGLETASFSLDYIDVKTGTGAPAAPHKWYTIHYSGYLVDGTRFDSSFDHPGHEPFVFPYGQHQVILGWDTGFDGMRVGGKRRLFIPYQLAYGANGKPPIPAKAELIFDVEFISQSDEKPAPPPTAKAPPPTPPAAAAPAEPVTPPAPADTPAPPAPAPPAPAKPQ